ncbi:MAG: MaoC family dehydratase N-terminal domain-containing protein [Ectobacillus sp.]
MTVSKQQVIDYAKAIGEQNPVYFSIEAARKLGYRTIPIPPALPIIFYRFFAIPWGKGKIWIHRSQRFTYKRQLYIDEPYECFIALEAVKERSGHSLYEQSLKGYNIRKELCFVCNTILVEGGNA